MFVEFEALFERLEENCFGLSTVGLGDLWLFERVLDLLVDVLLGVKVVL